METTGRQPVPVWIWQTTQRMSRAFDERLQSRGGSRPIWHILLALRSRPQATQREIAAEVGIREATLTHHLRAMEDAGLITRHRAPENRRVQQIAATEKGDALFEELRTVAMDFDRQLRTAIGSAEEIAAFRAALERISAVVDDGRPVPLLD